MKTDTNPVVASLQADVLRKLPGERRLALAVEMSVVTRTLLKAGLRRVHPAWSTERIRQEMLRRTVLLDPPVNASGPMKVRRWRP